MSGLDGAVLDEFTQGINAPANGQQGYVVFADAQAPRPNLTYKSPADAAMALKNELGAAAESKSPEPSTIAASGGTHVITHTIAPLTPYTVYIFSIKAQIRVGTTMQWYGERRLYVFTGSAGTVTNSADSNVIGMGSGGFTLTGSATGSTITATVTNPSANPGTVFASIAEVYRKVTPTP